MGLQKYKIQNTSANRLHRGGNASLLVVSLVQSSSSPDRLPSRYDGVNDDYKRRRKLPAIS